MTLAAEGQPRPRRCRGCPKLLTDPVSIARGYGPECAKRRGITTPAPARIPSRDGGHVPGQTTLTDLEEP
ncbi:DUF6011 domain-containing protein [Streptosporangium sandarakinum]